MCIYCGEPPMSGSPAADPVEDPEHRAERLGEQSTQDYLASYGRGDYDLDDDEDDGSNDVEDDYYI